jgi:hypothetical protein
MAPPFRQCAVRGSTPGLAGAIVVRWCAAGRLLCIAPSRQDSVKKAGHRRPQAASLGASCRERCRGGICRIV